MRKLFVTDLDGTLLENHDTISENNLKYINKLKALNHCFAIATGRPYNYLEFLQKQYKMNVDYFISLNGALIVDKNNNVIRHQVIPTEIVEAIVSEFYNKDWEIFFSTGFKNFRFASENKNRVDPNGTFIKDIEEIKKEKISMTAIWYKKEDVKYVDEVCREINSRFGDIVVAYRNVSNIDIVPLGCSKGSGVDYIMKREEIGEKNAFAIGDSWNDVSMFNSVEHSFTFRAAENELQKKARHIVDTVAECIEKYVIEDAS